MALCWIVNNLSYYHAARLGAYARLSPEQPWILEWTDRDELAALENRTLGQLPFRRRTMHPGVPLRDIRMPAARRVLWDALDQLQPTAVCVNGWGMFGSRSMLAWCLRRQVPAILMSESTAHDKVRSWWVESLKGYLVRLFSAALVGGSAHREYLLQLGFPESRIFQGYDVVDNNYFSRGASDVRSAPASRCQVEVQEPFFLACSRFSEKKNLARLIEAYALYRGSCNGKYWKLVILGEGELRGELESFRDRLGLSADVVMPGAKSYQDLPLYYGLASAFVHASTSEQWGLVVNEAMASGLPVLVSERCGCAPDLVTPRNGFTFDPTNVEALSGLMLRVSNGQCDLQRMGQASQEIISRWSPQTFAENLQAATRSATTGPPRRTRLHRCLPLLER